MKKKVSGQDLFNQYYENIHQERWPVLKAALLAPKKYIAYSPYDQCTNKKHTHLPHVYEAESFDPPKMINDKKNYYLMDMASAHVPFVLNPKKNSLVLDLCAAPGGKSLILATAFSIELTANELSRDRRERMRRVFKEYLNTEVFNNIRITNFDAKTWGLFEKDKYDAILLDAPCSSERHVMEDENEMKNWKEARTKNLHTTQWTMLSSALLALKPGGEILYSTCSISPIENDGVIRKMLDKRQNVEVIPIDLPIGSKTQYGWEIMPDITGFGPIYMCKIKKNES